MLQLKIKNKIVQIKTGYRIVPTTHYPLQQMELAIRSKRVLAFLATQHVHKLIQNNQNC